MSILKMFCANSVLVTIVVCCTYSAYAQNFLNLDFEYGVEKAQPRKWSVEGEGEHYFARLDSTTSKKGSHSLYVTQSKSDVFIFLRIPGKEIAGKTIKVTGYIKLVADDSLQAKLSFAEPGPRAPFSSKVANEKETGWQLMTNEVSFPQNFSSDRLLVALTTSGTGQFWFDDVTITINGKPYGDGPPDFREPTNKEIVLLNENAVPILYSKSNFEIEDVGKLKSMVGDATILALGENSHGSSSIYKLKLSLVKVLIKKFGFTLFALEMPVAEADEINRYVLYREGTKEEVIKNLAYKSWQTQEMLDIIEWIKSYNITAKRKVSFKGFDMQNGELAWVKVAEFSKRFDKNLAENLKGLKTIRDQANWKAIYLKSDSICKYLDLKTATSYPGVKPSNLSDVKHYMHVFLQSLSANYKTDSTKSRDAYMAENIDWLIKNAPKGSKAIVSADNTHISNASGKMGSYLKTIYGDQYLAMGFTFNTGTYSAYGEQKYYEVHPSYPGTVEYLFSKSRHQNFFLDIRKIKNLPFLNQSIGFRTIGSAPQETTQFAEIFLRNHFDAVVFIENSLHTTYLNE